VREIKLDSTALQTDKKPSATVGCNGKIVEMASMGWNGKFNGGGGTKKYQSDTRSISYSKCFHKVFGFCII